MNPFEMVVLIVFIVMVGSVLKSRTGHRLRRGQGDDAIPVEERAETLRLRQEVSELKERIKVLERITVEKENTLSRQIEELRDRS
jgi:uncharacterized protein YlxW (UPF0749 family)